MNGPVFQLVAGIVACASAVGCGGTTTSITDLAAPIASQASAPIISPAVLAEPDGLEIRQWAVRFDREALIAAISPYLDAAPITDPRTEKRLRDSGLRVIAVPIGLIESVRARMPLVGRIDRRWVGQAPEWTEAYAGERFGPGAPFRLGDERLILGEGRLRLIFRAWTEPDPRPRLRLDLALQHEPPRGPTALHSNAAPRRRGIVEEGLIFSSSVAELVLDGASVLLLIPDAPEHDWHNTESESEPEADDAPDPEDSLEPADWLPQPEPTADPLPGPPAPDTPTLGEALMVNTGSVGSAPRSRAVIVLIPRIAGRAGILP